MSLPRIPAAEGHGRGDAVLAGGVETRPEPAIPTWATADLTNVIPFVKRQREAGETGAQIRLVPGERPAPAALKQDRGGWMLALLLGSFAAHAGVYWVLNREPPPLASVGVESMSVEIVLGTDMPAGRAEEPAKSEQEPAQLSPGRHQTPVSPSA